MTDQPAVKMLPSSTLTDEDISHALSHCFTTTKQFALA